MFLWSQQAWVYLQLMVLLMLGLYLCPLMTGNVSAPLNLLTPPLTHSLILLLAEALH